VVSYSFNLNDIIIYINEIKENYSAEHYRKVVLDIRRLLKYLNVPFADDLQLPKIPKRRKIIKKQDIQKLVSKVELNCNFIECNFSLRSTEIYRLTLNDIDLNSRVIFLGAEKTKNYDDTVAFFNDEAQKALIEFFLEATNQNQS